MITGGKAMGGKGCKSYDQKCPVTVMISSISISSTHPNTVAILAQVFTRVLKQKVPQAISKTDGVHPIGAEKAKKHGAPRDSTPRLFSRNTWCSARRVLAEQRSVAIRVRRSEAEVLGAVSGFATRCRKRAAVATLEITARGSEWAC